MMEPILPPDLLRGKKALVVGVANEASIATGCARAFQLCGADVAVTYQNEKARPHVAPVAEEVGAALFLPLDVTDDAQLDAAFEQVRQTWGRLDLLVHSIAFAPKADLQGGLLNSSAGGFAMAMDISCHSFLRLARRAVPLMTEGGTLFAMSYHGADKVVPNYNLMGPVKAALESACRYLAYELGPQGIRVHAISPGPIATRAASGLKEFDVLLAHAVAEAPLHEPVDTLDVGMTCAHLASPLARHLTGSTHYIDGGLNILA
jgi:enoyl-[acyl-carrier protein] reductase I